MKSVASIPLDFKEVAHHSAEFRSVDFGILNLGAALRDSNMRRFTRLLCLSMIPALWKYSAATSLLPKASSVRAISYITETTVEHKIIVDSHIKKFKKQMPDTTKTTECMTELIGDRKDYVHEGASHHQDCRILMLQ